MDLAALAPRRSPFMRWFIPLGFTTMAVLFFLEDRRASFWNLVVTAFALGEWVKFFLRSSSPLGSGRTPVRGTEAMKADPDGTITLALSCGKCGQGINLWCQGWNETGPARPITFGCPWCEVNQRTEIPAISVSASRRHDDLGANMIKATVISGL